MRRALRKILPKTRKARFALIGLLLLVIGGASAEITSLPKFCRSCHIMETYYVSWTNDVHREVACVKCHIAPGTENFVKAKLNGLGQVVDDWLNRASTKPSASVSDFACMRSGCHVLGKLGEADRDGRSYHFDHGKHLDLDYLGIAVHCTTCHSHVQGGNHFEVNTNTCIACHLMNGSPTQPPAGPAADAAHGMQSALYAGSSSTPASSTAGAAASLLAPANCAACHSPPREPLERNGLKIDHAEYLRFGASCESCHRGATARPQTIDNAQCYTCHDFGLERAGNVEDLHRLHTEGEHKVECFNCHGVIQHGPAAQAMSLDTFDCRECHSAQHMVQRATYQTIATTGHPAQEHAAVSPMFLAHVDCTGCHVEQGSLKAKPGSGATVARAIPEACDKCHQPGFGQQLVPLWQRNTRELFDQVVQLMPAEHGAQQPTTAEGAALLKEARDLLETVRIDGSWGVHNPRYTQRLIEQAREKVLKARQVDSPVEKAEP